MSSANFVFDGEFRRKPQQNFGGRQPQEWGREALLARAQVERHRREKERIAARSVLTIQAGVRGFLIRSKLRKAERLKYYEISNLQTCDTLEKHGDQISRLIKFFDPKQPNDGFSLSQHALQLPQYKNQLLEKCFTDPLWSFRIRSFVKLGLDWYIQADGSKRKSHSHRAGVMFLQILLEEIPKFDQSMAFFVRLWLDLVASRHFFQLWYRECETAFKIKSNGVQGQLPENVEDLITVLKLPFQLVKRLEGVNTSFRIEQRILNGKRFSYGKPTTMSVAMILSQIYENFTQTFTNNIIPLDEQTSSSNQILTHLAPDFPWLSWSSYLINEYCYFVPLGSSESRSIMYAVLMLVPAESAVQFKDEFLNLLHHLIHSVDIRYAPMAADIKVEGEELLSLSEDFDDLDQQLLQSQSKVVFQYVQEWDIVFAKLKNYLTLLPLAKWIRCEQFDNWNAKAAVISCLIRNDPGRATRSFPFLVKLAHNREFLRRLYTKIQADGANSNFHDIISFTWLLNRLMNILHDAEFISTIPLNRDELGRLIIDLVVLYTNNVLDDKESVDTKLKKSSNLIVSKCLLSLHGRNTRLHIFPDDIFVSTRQSTFFLLTLQTHTITFESFLEPSTKLNNQTEEKLRTVLHEFPFAIDFHDRIAFWHRMIDLEKSQRYVPYGFRENIQIRRSMIYEDTFDKLSFENVPDIRNPIRISLVNTVGLLEAGVDGGGLLREFLTEAAKAGVDPNRGLFRLDSQNRIYPNPIAKKIFPDHWKHYFLIGRLVGKALYEQTLLELPLAGFFIQKCISGKVNLAVDYLATLDPALHNNLLSLKRFTGDFSSLGLDFTLTVNEFGETRTVNLKENGSSIMVDKTNVIEYIHLVADYKINKEMEGECTDFRRGLCSVLPILKIFSWREMQTLISGSQKPIDVQDWKQHTNYAGGYTIDHPCIKMFWQVMESLEERHLRKLLKFVTSCSRPPLLGFKDLVPNFGIQSAGHTLRLPTAATCMNLLKLPEFDDVQTLREKLIYAIDAEAGFELS